MTSFITESFLFQILTTLTASYRRYNPILTQIHASALILVISNVNTLNLAF